ncbi:MAG: TonB family protein [candidate division WOR-3 bacterium]|nr:MAG: TonB family protein [candidate division WOR-3 bacterium]
MVKKALCMSVLAGLCLTASAQTEEQAAVMPQLVGLDLRSAGKALARIGMEPVYVQVQADTAEVPEFHVVSQDPDSGALLEEAQEVLVRFNCHGMLKYWDSWVVPLLGDFRNTVSVYRVDRPPEPTSTPVAGYPPELLKFSFSGEAKVEALVDFDGSVLAARVVESSGQRQADSAACQAALSSEFSPATHYDVPVRVWFPLPYAWDYREARGLDVEPIDKGHDETEASP